MGYSERVPDSPSDTREALAGPAFPELLQMGRTEAQKNDVICRVSGAVPDLAHGPQLDTGSLKCEAEMPIRSQPPLVELWSLY